MKKHTTTLSLIALMLMVAVAVAAPIFHGYPAHAAAITVNTTDDELIGDGDCSLREAIAAANTNAPVDACPAGEPAPVVDRVNFSVTGTITLTGGQLTVSDGVTIDGPGATSLTISGDNASRVFETIGTINVRFVDLTVTNGNIPEGGGGGILSQGSTLTIERSVVSNSFSLGGGGIFYSGGVVTINHSTVTGNSIGQDLTGGTGGGGIRGIGDLTITNSVVSGNTAGTTGVGGGIFNFFGSVVLTNSTVSGNSAGIGGGIDNDSTLVINDSTVSGNSADVGGGVVNRDRGTANVTNSTISGNSAFVNNDSFAGGITNSGVLTLNNSTVTDNFAPPVSDTNRFAAGGIFAGGTTTLKNTVVSNNSSTDCSGPTTSAGHNLDSDNTCGFDSDPSNPDAADGDWVDTDPLLGPLADIGGPTETHALCTAAGVPDASCTGPSPAIDTGDNVGCPPTDQRGFVPRPADGNGDNVAVCDIGSYEVGASAPSPSPSPSPIPSPTPVCPVDDNDFDNDGSPNKRDRDDDNDGIRDGPDSDNDNDNIPDREDPDDDNDSIPDKMDRDDGRPLCP